MTDTFSDALIPGFVRTEPSADVVARCERVASVRRLAVESGAPIVTAYQREKRNMGVRGASPKKGTRPAKPNVPNPDRMDALGMYPDAPKPIPLHLADIPEQPGIYFVWDCGVVVYVGQSVALARRVTMNHEKIWDEDRVSFLLFPADDLVFAECFYICRYRPTRNLAAPAPNGVRKRSG